MTFNERVLAQTRQFLLPKVVYNVFGSNVLAWRLISNGKRGKGVAIEKAIKYQSSGQAQGFSGLDTFQAQQLDTKLRLNVEMKAMRQAVGVAGLEAIANKGEVQTTDLVQEALEETMDELFDSVGDISYEDGTGSSGKVPNGMKYIVDDGTNAPTFEGQSRTTYPVLKATVTDLTAVSGTLTLGRLAALYSSVSSGTGMTTPTLMVAQDGTWDLYENLLTATVRENYSMMGYYSVDRKGGAVRGGSNEGLSGTAGFVAVTYKGIPFVRDEKATANRILMLNENHLDWYGWDASGVFGYESVKFSHNQVETTYGESPMSDFSGFNWSGWRTPTNQFAGVADIILVGNYGSWQPRRQGVLTTVTNS